MGMALAQETLSYGLERSTRQKVTQILGAAREVFMRHGYGDTSMDEVARTAGVSKATLYAHFESKPQLFAAMVTAECRRVDIEMPNPGQAESSAAETLFRIGYQFLEFLVSPGGLAIFRVVVAEVDRFPELGIAIYEAGPARLKGRLSVYLADATARGELAVDDTELAAVQFLGMVKGDLHIRCLFDTAYRSTTAEIDRRAKAAVDTFLARYGRTPPVPSR
jgi:TetR/AcrR family transcriptional regulator, mexJK operon transcriptional repressor